MISGDWNVAKVALQIIAEQGPGILMAESEAAENRAVQRLFGRG